MIQPSTSDELAISPLTLYILLRDKSGQLIEKFIKTYMKNCWPLLSRAERSYQLRHFTTHLYSIILQIFYDINCYCYIRQVFLKKVANNFKKTKIFLAFPAVRHDVFPFAFQAKLFILW